jgi:hypothetical protein
VIEEENGPEYEVEEVVGKRMTKEKGVEYLIRWKNYGPEDDTWELVEGLSRARRAVHNFKSRGRASGEVGYHVANLSQCSCAKPNPTPNPMTTLIVTPTAEATSRVTTLSWTMMDNNNGPHQSGTDRKTTHQDMIDGISDHHAKSDGKCDHQSGTDGNRHLHDGNQQSRSTITGVLCKWVLAYVKWHQGCYPGVDRLLMDSFGC